jgi:ferredoxin
MTKIKRKIIEIDEELCDGCGNCIPECPEQAIAIVETSNGPKARLVADLFCDGLGACLGHCPPGALRVVEKEVEPYDEEATVSRIKEVAPQMLNMHLRHMQEHNEGIPEPPKFTGCPSSRTMQWSGDEKPPEPSPARVGGPSKLRQWPVQLHLVPPFAPYFKDADLAIIADCVPFSYSDFHRDFLDGRAIAVGCPKLNDVNAYLQKITDIIRIGSPRRLEVVIMEVPCCSGLTNIVQQAMRNAEKNLPLTQTVVGIRGDIKG